jgi:DNA-binding transcriptional MerR regulator
MQIKELPQRTNLPAKTIRYDEGTGLPPARLPNGSRDYEETAVSRIKLVAGTRSPGLPLKVICREKPFILGAS